MEAIVNAMLNKHLPGLKVWLLTQLNLLAFEAQAEWNNVTNRAVTVYNVTQVTLAHVPKTARRAEISIDNTAGTGTIYAKSGVQTSDTVSSTDYGIRVLAGAFRAFPPGHGLVIAISDQAGGVAIVVHGGWRSDQ